MAIEHFFQSAAWFLKSNNILKEKSPSLQDNELISSLKEQEIGEVRLKHLIKYLLSVVLYENKQDQHTIVEHLLSSIAEEENLKFSHLLYVVDEAAVDEKQHQTSHNPISRLTIRDWQNSRFIVEAICQQSLQHASNNQEIRRYQLELSQWLQFKQKLLELMPQQANALLQTIVRESEIKQKKLLQMSGFKLAQNNRLAEILLKFPHLAQHRLYLGQRLAYIMPPSEVHPGGLSVLVVNQPIFDLDSKQLFLHQTQLLVDLNFDQLLALAAQLGIPPIPTNYSKQMKESYLLNNILSIPDSLNSLSNTGLIRSLIQQFNPNDLDSLKPINPKLIEQYTQLLIDVITDEVKNLNINKQQAAKNYDYAEIESAFDSQTQTRLAHFFYSIIFKGLKNPKFLPQQHVLNQVKQLFYADRSNDQHFAHASFEAQAAHKLGFWPATQKVVSLSQCVALSPSSIVSQLSNQLKINNPADLTNLNHQQLSNLIGTKRAESWHQGRCRNCGRRTLIGERGLCYICELTYEHKEKSTLAKLLSTQANFTDQTQNSSKRPEFKNLPSIGLSEFISGEDTRLVEQATNNV
jgi:hypothetical protein